MLFNISTLATSAVITFVLLRLLVKGESLPVRLAVAVCAYFISNTGMVSLVLSLTEQRPFTNVCLPLSFSS